MSEEGRSRGILSSEAENIYFTLASNSPDGAVSIERGMLLKKSSAEESIFDESMTLKEMAKRFGCSVTAFWKSLRKHEESS